MPKTAAPAKAKGAVTAKPAAQAKPGSLAQGGAKEAQKLKAKMQAFLVQGAKKKLAATKGTAKSLNLKKVAPNAAKKPVAKQPASAAKKAGARPAASTLVQKKLAAARKPLALAQLEATSDE